jgi:hypothetical protein
MPDGLLDSSNPSLWGLWIPIAIGVVAGVVTLLVGRLVILRMAGPIDSGADSDPDESAIPLTPTTLEMRNANRRGGNAVAVFIADPHKTEEPQRGWVVYRSAGGLCVALDNPVDSGATLRIRVCNAPVTVPWAEVEVKSCRKDGNQWEAGCQFVVTPSYNVLMLFG